MEVVFLSRLQFAIAASFHYLFPPTTLGLTIIIVIIEGIYLKTKSELYLKLSTFLIKILTLIFVIGVATGITLEFAFGTNWAEYSRVVGDIFGAPLAAEGIFAFFLESTFLGILIFGRKKVSAKFYWISTVLVAIGSHISALWILVANSFMQTPAGYKLVDGKAILTDFWAAVFNPSTIERVTHTVVGGWITGSLLVGAIAAYYLLKNRYIEFSKKLLKISLIIFVISGFLQLFSGHMHSVQVAKTQPVKMAAFELLWETKSNAPLSIIAIPNFEKENNDFEIAIPSLLSILIEGCGCGTIKGLKEFPVEERPPLILTYTSYHIMIMLGMLFVIMALISLFMLFKDRAYKTKWFLLIILFSFPLPHIANLTGWIAAEVGRQPWAVYGILKTKDAISSVTTSGEVLFSLITLSLIYTLIFIVFMKILLKFIHKGPEDISSINY